MRKHTLLAVPLDRQRLQRLAGPACELIFVLSSLALLNLTAWANLHSLGALPDIDWQSHAPQLLMPFLGINLAALLLLLWWRRRVLIPWRQLRSIVREAGQSLNTERAAPEVSPSSVRELAGSIARFASGAQLAYSRCLALQCELDESRQMMAQIVLQHQVALSSTNRELIEQYRSVLAYANYLDDHIRGHHGDAQLRYDFDDVCESGFNLKLIAQSLELLRSHTPEITHVPLAPLLQQTVIALAPSLERRVMQLSTAGVEEHVFGATDIHLLSHAVWMMLLGTIRYAAAESTLRLRCLSTAGGQAIISIGINELEPGQLSAEERHAHLLRQLQHTSPHLFAETIRAHASAQLAALMLERAGGTLNVLPISTHACEISLILPLVKK